MKNLKRTLSLALASVMLLGMMVVGSSAAFADADQIVNTEAVEITAGLGLFAGSDGKFNPTGTVTRAQMATVIVKMLYGSEINADQFKGSGKFSDTVTFEGGWAEGYINLCANLKIVAGYGDGTFKPGQAVTTAEAVTMIINALGVDAGEGTWPLTVMAKAEEMELFEELDVKPGTNVALTRDQLAAIVLEGIQYSPAGVKGYRVTTAAGKTYEVETATDAVLIAGETGTIEEIKGEDTLWATVFEVKEFTGYVTGNQATDPENKFTVITNATGEIKLDLETGLDMIGHYVTGYYVEKYTSEAKPGEAYCIVDEAEYITVAEDVVADKADFKDAFGTLTLTTAAGYITDGNYVAGAATKAAIDTATAYNYTTKTANAGTYVIDEDNNIIGFIETADVKVGKVGTIVTTPGKEAISLAGQKWDNNADTDVIDEYEGIAKNDIVTYVLVGADTAAQADKIMVTKTTTVEGKITKTFTKDGDKYITVNGTDYAQTGAGTAEGLLTTVSDFDATYTVYLTSTGAWIGFESTDAKANLNDIYYVKAVYSIEEKNAYNQTITTTYAQVVDMEGKESQVVLGIDYTAGNTDDVAVTGDLAGTWTDAKCGLYTFKAATGTAASKIDAKVGTKLTTTYDKDEKNLYAGTLATGTEISAKETVYAGARVNADTKFILINGDAQTELKTAVLTGTIKKTLAEDADIVLSVDAKGNVIIEAVVIDNTTLSVSADNGIYISAGQIAGEAGVGSNEYQYNVYFLKDGTVAPITIKGQWTNGAGFYEYEYDATEDLYKLNVATFDAYDTTFTSIYGESTLITPAFTKGIEAGKAFIFDVRGEEAIKDHETCNYAISSLADLEMAAEEHDITFSVLLDDAAADAENVLAIFITGVVYNPEA